MVDKKPAKKAAKKRPVKKAVVPKAKSDPKQGTNADRIAVIKTEMVGVRELQPYFNNPRIGNVDKIAKSLHINRQFKPIVVNLGSKTGRAMEILAGNHTWLGSRKPVFWTENDGAVKYDKPAWNSILASFVDVDDDEAAKINLADNKTADDGTYDEALLAEIIDGLPDVSGTGYTEEEAQVYRDQLIQATADLDTAMPEVEVPDGEAPKRPKFDETDLGDEDIAAEEDNRVRPKGDAVEDEPEVTVGAGVEIMNADDTIKGAFTLSDDMYFDHLGWHQIPRLRKDMLVQPDDLPDNLTSWAGSATRDNDDPDQWWLYNYGVDSTSGMKDVSKVIMAFYTYDDYFEGWWHEPARYVSKVINSGIEMILTPDFSDDINHGRGFCIWQLFRVRWLGRYFQEAGLKIIPNISWPDGDMEFLKDLTLATLPKDIPVIAMQMQTFNKELTDEHKAAIKSEVQLVMTTIKPKVLLLYGGQPGYDWFTKEIKTGKTDVRFILNRTAKLSASRKGKKKKETI